MIEVHLPSTRMSDMFVRIWEYTVPRDSVEVFTRVYGPSGDWVQLFSRATGYVGTELCRSADRPDQFVTVDRWNSDANWTTFLDQWGAQYQTLDASLEGLATLERPVLEGFSWPSP
jgi:heme-degrading monooxygenase HmoA